MLELPKESVDLIYLDPPFKSNRSYNAIYKDETGRPLPDQIAAFCDMWELDDARLNAIRTMPVLMREAGIDDATAELWRLWMRALRGTQPDLLAYISYMTERLLVMHRLLKSTGSLYFHCDPTVSHYMKPLLDAIFGHQNFRSEVIWKRTFSHGRAKRWGPIHDTILFYSKSGKYRWNRVYQDYDPKYVEKNFKLQDERGYFQAVSLTGPGIREDANSGSPWRGINPTETGRHWEVPPDRILHSSFEHPSGYAQMSIQERLDVLDAAGLIYWPEKGKTPRHKQYLNVSPGTPLQDVIWDIPPVSGKEDMGYDTQKPIALLDRIIRASSRPGEIVLDPFCGCATTIDAAHRLGRQWIGIDIAIHAIKRVARIRLEERLGLVEDQDFAIEGVPQSLEGAQDLWRRDKYNFQKWAIEQVDGFFTTKRTVDGGVDGRIYFAVPGDRDLQSMIVEAKGGKRVNVSDWRALKGVLSRDESLLAGLITMKSIGDRQLRNFSREVAELEPMEILGVEYPRMQILNVEEILNGKRFTTPTVAARHLAQPRMPGISA